MDETRAVWPFYLVEAAGPMEMAVDVLNLFLIKEKALACVRDELLEREPGRRSQREAPAQQGGGMCSPLCPCPTPTCLPQAGTVPPLPLASPSQFQQRVPLLLLVPAPWGLLLGLSHSLVVWASSPSSCPQSTHLYNRHKVTVRAAGLW